MIEQSLLFKESEILIKKLKDQGESYRQKFGFKFLISAKNKSGEEIYSKLEEKLKNTLMKKFKVQNWPYGK